jgi:ABC-type branched-subunit amino acid transport system substrate-binding protein
MSLNNKYSRRWLIQSSALALIGLQSARAQSAKLATPSKTPAVVQIADMSAAQTDVSKDFLVGSRAAWQEFAQKGGLKGKPLVHQIIEVDGSAAGLRAAFEGIQAQGNAVALVGTVGDRTANALTDLIRNGASGLAHIAPWIHNTRQAIGENTFSIFATRQEQIAHALNSLSVMGVKEIGAVYASATEWNSYHDDVEATAATLKVRCKTIKPTADLQALGRTLGADSPRILVFLGGTPELIQFSQGINQVASQRYIVAMSDVNLQTLQQSGLSRHASVIATQVVPLVNSNEQIVRSYRETLSKLFDEPPTPQSLAGYVSARYCQEVLQGIDGALTRSSILQAVSRRGSVDLGGLTVDAQGSRKSAAYVTQSMLSADGRVVG